MRPGRERCVGGSTGGEHVFARMAGVNVSSVVSPVAGATAVAKGGAEGASLEGALAALEARLAALMPAATALVKDLRAAKDAARVGHCRLVAEAIGRASSRVDGVLGEVRSLGQSWSFDVSTYLGEGSFTAEITAAAAAAGIGIEPRGERLVAFPTVIRVRPDLAAVEIDGRRETGLRPANIVAVLAACQKRASHFRAETFLEALETAYLRLMPGLADGRIIRLAEIWQLFTLLPGSAGEYSIVEFGRDLNLLDESGLTLTRAGRQIAFAASSGTRDNATVVGIDRNGRPHHYWGVSFS